MTHNALISDICDAWAERLAIIAESGDVTADDAHRFVAGQVGESLAKRLGLITANDTAPSVTICSRSVSGVPWLLRHARTSGDNFQTPNKDGRATNGDNARQLASNCGGLSWDGLGDNVSVSLGDGRCRKSPQSPQSAQAFGLRCSADVSEPSQDSANLDDENFMEDIPW